MRPAVLKAWTDLVRESVLRRFPMFSEVKKRQPTEERGLLKFEWRPRSDLICGIALRPLDEAFDAWIGWSRTGEFPYAAAQRPVTQKPHTEFDQRTLMVPSIVLAGRPGSASWHFWNPSDELVNDPGAFGAAFAEYYTRQLTPEEARELVKPAIEEAMQEIELFGLPYLRSRVEHPG